MSRTIRIAVTLGFWSLALDARATPIFVPLGHLPGTQFSTATDVSADGSVVVGYSGPEAFRWEANTGMEGLGDLPGGNSSESAALAVSADGTVAVGYSDSAVRATRWTAGEGPVELPGEQATGVSADGSAIAGFSNSVGAYRWTEESGVELIGPQTTAWGMSGDGSTVVGGSRVGPYKWTAKEGLVHLGSLPPGTDANDPAVSVSYDGSVVVGESNSQSFRWTAETGMIALGQLAGRTRALAVSADGETVVGFDIGVPTLQAFIWDAEHGMRALRDVLIEQGLDLSGWELWTAQGISDDGTVIVGDGQNPEGHVEAWLVRMEAPIPEPSTSLLVAIALLGLAALRGRGDASRATR